MGKPRANIGFHVTPEEKRAIRRAAAEVNLVPTEFIRRQLFGNTLVQKYLSVAESEHSEAQNAN